MLTAGRSLELASQSAPELPRVPELEALYAAGTRLRKGDVCMIAGRSGTGKSALAMWWVQKMNLPTLYLSADMSAYQASVRLACSVMGLTSDEVEAKMIAGGNEKREVLDALASRNLTFSFGAITTRGIEEELDAWVELWDAHPEVIVIDNFMDMEDAQADYAAQMEMMQVVNEVARETEATVIVLHHASDKSWQAGSDPWMPPSRQEIKGGLSEKPALSLTVALNPHSDEYRIATVKQRMGPHDPTGKTYISLTADLSTMSFTPWVNPWEEAS